MKLHENYHYLTKVGPIDNDVCESLGYENSFEETHESIEHDKTERLTVDLAVDMDQFSLFRRLRVDWFRLRSVGCIYYFYL